MKRACVIGDPIAHSRSPLIHGFWLKQLGIQGSYGREHVRRERLPAFLRGLRLHGYDGCNVTVPHKEAAFGLVDEATPLASALGAVNTIWFDAAGRLHGDNTDVHGFVASLDQEAPGWRAVTATALILGAGGAALSIAAALSGCGVTRLIVANRSADRAASLASRQARGIEAIPFNEVPRRLAGVDLLVNTTTLGMEGQPELDLDLDDLDRAALISDIVYAPLETRFLARASARGHRVVGGLGMLLHQAVPGFERWFGVRPEVTPELRRHVAADIAPRAA